MRAESYWQVTPRGTLIQYKRKRKADETQGPTIVTAHLCNVHTRLELLHVAESCTGLLFEGILAIGPLPCEHLDFLDAL